MDNGDEDELRPEVRRVLEAIHDLEKIPDAGDRARALGQLLPRMPKLSSTLRQMRQQAIETLRQQGHSWGQIGTIIGRDRQRAKDIAEGKSWRKGRAVSGPADADVGGADAADGSADSR